MTKKELNKRVNRLRLLEIKKMNTTDMNERDLIEAKIRPELKILMLADDEFEYMSKKSILTVIRLNLKYRIKTIHWVGLNINLNNI